jgi:hypothetical protein
MRQVRIVLTPTLVVVVAQSGALNTHPYGLDPSKPCSTANELRRVRGGDVSPATPPAYEPGRSCRDAPIPGLVHQLDIRTGSRTARSSDELTSASNRSNTHGYSRWSV